MVAARVDLARADSPDAIGIREVTRAAGLSPNAAYRHFADRAALVVAVAAVAQELCASTMSGRIDAARSAITGGTDDAYGPDAAVSASGAHSANGASSAHGADGAADLRGPTGVCCRPRLTVAA